MRAKQVYGDLGDKTLKREKFSIWTIFKILVLGFMVFTIIYPFVYMTAVSLSGKLYVMKNEVTFYPKGFTLEMYKYVFNSPTIFTAYRNTILYVALGTAVSLSVTSAAAYALSKTGKLAFVKFFNIFVTIPMFFNSGMIPQFLNVKSLGLVDTIWAIVFVTAVSSWYLIIMKSFFISFPSEIEDSGHVDGLNDFGVFLRLVLPTSKAVLAAVGLFYAVDMWNSFFVPYLYIQTPSKYPLQCVLRNLIIQGEGVAKSAISQTRDLAITEDGLKYATIVISVIPIIMVYPFIQKYFVKGVMLGSVKG